jgi:LysR family cyn operon transcriptional activator
VRIGATHTFNLRLIPECVTTLLTRHPGIRGRVEESAAKHVEEALLRGNLDVAVSYPPRNAEPFFYEPLYNEELMLVVPRHHPSAARKSVRMVDLHRQALVLPTRGFGTRDLLDACFRSVKAEPDVVAEMNTAAPLLESARLLKVLAIASSFAITDSSERVLVRINDPTPVRTPVLLWHKEATQTSPARAFAEIVKQQIHDLSNGGSGQHAAPNSTAARARSPE